MIGLTLIDKYGRKSLMFVGSLGLPLLHWLRKHFFSERTGIVFGLSVDVHCVFAFSQGGYLVFIRNFPIPFVPTGSTR
jgi:hypothetical protein